MGKIITVSILGCGSRGAWAYGAFMNQLKDKYKIVSLCDTDAYARAHVSESFDVDAKNVFADENEFFKEKRSELLIIATQDKDHVRQAKVALSLGYNLLLEKPISKYLNELKELKEYAEKYNRTVIVCHVLRYSVQIRKLMEIINSGRIGRIISIQHLEQVAFFHQAHSFVRGNWRREDESAPMIMAKCCHDLDLLQALAGSKCKRVSSMGSLAFFNKENAPEGSADRCINCKYVDTCEYSAKTIYLKWWQEAGRP
ncbi:MAG: Gfo/Idh/MocA family oxidoreductase, partial [Clostridia bacterium]|nr:Gfo/Idh/MocA family oxidoreductase [Clostridia bacterium]